MGHSYRRVTRDNHACGSLTFVGNVFKKGNTHQPKNYRPVSLTSIACKFMEGFIRNQLVDHIKRNRLLPDDQHVFLSGLSCITQLLEVLEEWTKVLESDGSFNGLLGKHLTQCLIYISSTNCETIYGLQGSALEWIKSLLLEWKQHVFVNGQASQWAHTVCCVH